jgi:hypothetical protein
VRRWLLGLVTLWPLADFTFFVAVIGAATIARGGDLDRGLVVSDQILIGLQIATTFVVAVLLGVCLHHVHGRRELPPGRRTLWMVTLLVGSALAMPIYWWRHMRPHSGPRAAQ